MSILVTGCTPTHEWNGTVYQDPAPAPALPLQTVNDAPFNLEDWRGLPALIYFGYTHCPDVCPATLADLAWMKDQLAASGVPIHVAFITVDPARDTPQVVHDYLSRFDAEFVGLHGSEQQLANAKQGYGIYSAIDEGGGEENYTVTHTSRVFLIDSEGLLRASYTFGTPRQGLLADLRYLLES